MYATFDGEVDDLYTKGGEGKKSLSLKNLLLQHLFNDIYRLYVTLSDLLPSSESLYYSTIIVKGFQKVEGQPPSDNYSIISPVKDLSISSRFAS